MILPHRADDRTWPAPTDALSTTYIIRPDGTGDYSTIKGAIVAAADGGAIYAAFAEPIVQDCCFEGNTCSEKGGAVWVRSTSPEFSDCVFVNNSSTGDGLVMGGGAIHFQPCVAPIVWGCTFIAKPRR